MEGLYRQGEMDFDAVRARRVSEWLLANPESGGIWMIEAKGSAIGYMAVTTCVSLEFGGRHALLDELFVDAAWRGKGVGPQAIEFATEWGRSRGFTALRLEVGDENPHGLHVYAKAGFAIHPDRRLMTRWI
jgi:GNAT superfamily N-acetyltransferase